MKQEIETLESAYEYIPNLYSGILKIGDLFAANDEAQSHLMLMQIIEGLKWLVEAVTLTQDTQTDKIDIKDLTQSLTELVEGMEDNDNVVICDILEYEMIPVIEKWYESIGKTLQGCACNE